MLKAVPAVARTECLPRRAMQLWSGWERPSDRSAHLHRLRPRRRPTHLQRASGQHHHHQHRRRWSFRVAGPPMLPEPLRDRSGSPTPSPESRQGAQSLQAHPRPGQGGSHFPQQGPTADRLRRSPLDRPDAPQPPLQRRRRAAAKSTSGSGCRGFREHRSRCRQDRARRSTQHRCSPPQPQRRR